MRRLIVTGASGFIGSHVAELAVRSGWEVLGVYHSHPLAIDGCRMISADIGDREKVLSLVSDFGPDAIVHAAADANIDHCEAYPEEARRCNVEATSYVVEAAERVDAHMVFISTDAVFDGRRGMYSEEDIPNPINLYAETKLQAEQIVLENLPATVIRTSINYGHRLAPHQGSFYQDILNALQSGKSIPVFYDQYRNPIEVGHLAAALLDLAEIQYSGLLHVAGSQRCSRKELAEAVCRYHHLPQDLLIPKSQDEVPFKVARSRDISMCVEKAQAVLSVPLPDLDMGLRALIGCH